MSATLSLINQFLIAMPSLKDANFSRTVTYICQHNEEGAMGIVINQPLQLTLGDVLADLSLSASETSITESPVFLGGPVQCDRGFVLHQPLGKWGATLKVGENIGITASRNILESIAKGEGPKKSMVALGYAGWGPGQLEDEMCANSWLSGPADMRVIFELPPEQRWQAAALLAGVDIHRLAPDAGHA